MNKSIITAILNQDIPLTRDNIAKARQELAKLEAVRDDAIVANNALSAILGDSKASAAMPDVNWPYCRAAHADLHMSLLLSRS